MSAEPDDPNGKDDATRIGGAPPSAPRPASRPPAPPEDEGTRIAPAAPPRPPAPSPPVLEAEGTRIAPALPPPPPGAPPPRTAPPMTPTEPAEEGTRITPSVPPPPPPPRAPQAAPSPPAAQTPPAPPAGDDATRLAPAPPPPPPPRPALPSEEGAPIEPRGSAPPAPPGGDATIILPRAPAQAPAGGASRDVSRTVGGTSEADDATILVAPSAAAQAARLERVAPKDKGETLQLTKGAYVLGRSRSSDIPLFSATASREHARLARQGGRWAIEPLALKTVVAGGVRVTRGTVQLTHEMRLKLGEDEFVFLDESAPPSVPEAGRTWWSRVLAFFSRWARKAGG